MEIKTNEMICPVNRFHREKFIQSQNRNIILISVRQGIHKIRDGLPQGYSNPFVTPLRGFPDMSLQYIKGCFMLLLLWTFLMLVQALACR